MFTSANEFIEKIDSPRPFYLLMMFILTPFVVSRRVKRSAAFVRQKLGPGVKRTVTQSFRGLSTTVKDLDLQNVTLEIDLASDGLVNSIVPSRLASSVGLSILHQDLRLSRPRDVQRRSDLLSHDLGVLPSTHQDETSTDRLDVRWLGVDLWQSLSGTDRTSERNHLHWLVVSWRATHRWSEQSSTGQSEPCLDVRSG